MRKVFKPFYKFSTCPLAGKADFPLKITKVVPTRICMPQDLFKDLALKPDTLGKVGGKLNFVSDVGAGGLEPAELKTLLDRAQNLKTFGYKLLNNFELSPYQDSWRHVTYNWVFQPQKLSGLLKLTHSPQIRVVSAKRELAENVDPSRLVLLNQPSSLDVFRASRKIYGPAFDAPTISIASQQSNYASISRSLELYSNREQDLALASVGDKDSLITVKNFMITDSKNLLEGADRLDNLAHAFGLALNVYMSYIFSSGRSRDLTPEMLKALGQHPEIGPVLELLQRYVDTRGPENLAQLANADLKHFLILYKLVESFGKAIDLGKL